MGDVIPFAPGRARTAPRRVHDLRPRRRDAELCGAFYRLALACESALAAGDTGEAFALVEELLGLEADGASPQTRGLRCLIADELFERIMGETRETITDLSEL